MGAQALQGNTGLALRLPSYSTVRASLAQLGERQTEDLKVPGSIPGGGIIVVLTTAIGEKRVLSSVVEHRIADPVVTGSNPVVPLYLSSSSCSTTLPL